MALGTTQPLTEMSTRNLPGGEGAAGGSNYDILKVIALQVVMTPSSMRLAELRLCLWWRRIVDQRVRRDTALGRLVVPLGNCSLGVWISMTSPDWRLISHKGQWRLTAGASHAAAMTLGHHYGLPGTNAGEHSYGGSFGYLSCLPRVPLRCRKPSGSTL
jgi:hypothetical protein